MPSWLFLLIPLAVVVLWGVNIAVLKTRKGSVDDGAHDVPHGDVVHVPFGATPRSLVEHSHGGEVPHG